jgi:CHASE3 domain sensor protein
VLRTLFSFRALILVFGLLAVGLPIALVGQLGIVRTLTAVNADISQSRGGSLAAASVLQLQLDEETGLRGFAASGQRLFLEPFTRARATMPAELGRLSEALEPPVHAAAKAGSWAICAR